MCSARAYLDTCIVSGLAKGDLKPDSVDALRAILADWNAGKVELFTSDVVRQEILKIPPEHRARHSDIYGWFSEVPLASTHFRIPPFRPLPMFRRKDRLLASLERLLPDAPDAQHVFQTSKAGLPYLITVDRRTLLNHAASVLKLCSVRLVTPVGFWQTLSSSE